MVILIPPPNKLGDLSGPVDTSSQVSAPDDAEMGKPPWRKSPLPPFPEPRHQGLVAVPLLWTQAISEKRPTSLWGIASY